MKSIWKIGCKNMSNYIYVDCETTGLKIWKKTTADELLSVSVLDDSGECLFHSLIKPERHKSWKDAEKINGISPEKVMEAPHWGDVKKKVKKLLNGKDVVFYNWYFDAFFIRDALTDVNTIHCAMLEYADYIDPVCGRWRKLTDAVFNINPDFEFDAHNSLEDCRATREVWHFLLKNGIFIDDYKSDFDHEVAWLNSVEHKYYFDIPEAKDNEEIRANVKGCGCYWETKKQCWVLKLKDIYKLPEYLGQFKQLDPKTLPTYRKQYIYLKHPQKAKVVACLRKYKGVWDSRERAWWITLPEKAPLPQEIKDLIDEFSK